MLLYFFIIQALENLLLERPPSSWETSSFSFLRKCLVTLVYQNTCVTKSDVVSNQFKTKEHIYVTCQQTIQTRLYTK